MALAPAGFLFRGGGELLCQPRKFATIFLRQLAKTTLISPFLSKFKKYVSKFPAFGGKQLSMLENMLTLLDKNSSEKLTFYYFWISFAKNRPLGDNISFLAKFPHFHRGSHVLHIILAPLKWVLFVQLPVTILDTPITFS